MELKKIDTQEFATLPNFDVEYEDSAYAGQMSKDAYDILANACVDALHGYCDDMLHDLYFDQALLAREMKTRGAFARIVKRLYEHGVASGDAGCCCNLANLYHNTSGRGSAEDYARAVELYELGSDRGDTQSMINLGYIYYYGRGCERDYARAYECYARAALTDTNPEAYWKLGDLYASGKGVRKSDRIAWQLYSKAYELAGKSPLAARAAHHMADYLMRGIDGAVGPDPERALGLYVQAEAGYYHLIDAGLTYYQRQLDQSIEGQQLAREALQKRHLDIRAGE